MASLCDVSYLAQTQDYIPVILRSAEFFLVIGIGRLTKGRKPLVALSVLSRDPRRALVDP
jgi:hypothetical protein